MKVKRQPAVKGGRHPMYPQVTANIENEVERICRIYGVSRSWVIATVLADAFHIKNCPRYYDVVKPRLRRVK
jgi:hypothetical protein